MDRLSSEEKGKKVSDFLSIYYEKQGEMEREETRTKKKEF